MVIWFWRAQVDFVAVVEHGFIPARVRSERARLRRKGLATIWAPASQDFSHVGNAGVGVVSMRSAPVSLPTFATAQFRRFFDYGRAIRCMLPLSASRFTHLVVLYGYQGADTDAEQLSPPKSLAWQMGFRLGSGLTWNLLGHWLGVADSLLLPFTVLGIPLVITAETSWWVALLRRPPLLLVL